MTDDSNLAPPNILWHEEYERVFIQFCLELERLQGYPDFEKAEDLGDYVETIDVLLSFRPRSRDDVCMKIHEEFYPELRKE